MELVTLRTFDNYFYANIILTKLRAAGIECYLKDEYTVTIDPLLSNAIGGIKLVVKDKDESSARRILNNFDADYKNAVSCPVCRSNNIILIPKQNIENYVTAISTWLFSSYAVSAENVYHCENCGYESETLPENEDLNY